MEEEACRRKGQSQVCKGAHVVMTIGLTLFSSVTKIYIYTHCIYKAEKATLVSKETLTYYARTMDVVAMVAAALIISLAPRY